VKKSGGTHGSRVGGKQKEAFVKKKKVRNRKRKEKRRFLDIRKKGRAASLPRGKKSKGKKRDPSPPTYNKY